MLLVPGKWREPDDDVRTSSPLVVVALPVPVAEARCLTVTPSTQTQRRLCKSLRLVRRYTDFTALTGTTFLT
jgi:hypothetical protein